MRRLYIENDGKIAFYNRFVDMTDLKVIEIDFDTFSFHINRYRRLIKPDTPVKISLFIPENYIGGFPHLYKSMLSNSQFSIEISDSLEECAKYLAVDKKLLEDTVR